MTATITPLGTPVVNVRQWVWGLSPNAAGNGWNYIAASYNYPASVPVEWAVVKNFTAALTPPTVSLFNTTSKHYPNSLYIPTAARGEIRAANGRIYWPLFLNTFACYDPTTEAITEIAAFTESPAINPNQSTIPYSVCFDTTGRYLYFATQESANRPTCICVLDTTTNTITVLGYAGDSEVAGTTYGYYVAADVATAKKFVYIAYGEDPWQLWALDVTPGGTFGTATKLAAVSAAGFVNFTEVVGSGWVANVNDGTATTKYWCLDGALYAYTPGQPPPSGAPATRTVTPGNNALVSPPGIDAAGAGVFGWRANGSSGAYTYLNFTVDNATPVAIESLVSTNDGVLGNAEQYNGFFQVRSPSNAHTWYGPASGLVSGGPRINVGGLVYFAGYPNGALYEYNPDQPWSTTNPLARGSYSVNGSLAGIKYADVLAWAAGAGGSGRLYCAGSRDRNGVGSGIGSWDKTTHAFAGTFAAAGMDVCLPTGLLDDASAGCVVMATRLITPPGTASLFVFDYAFNLVASKSPVAGLSNLGQLFATSTPHVVCGITQSANGKIALYQYNVQSFTLVSYIETAITGTPGSMAAHPLNSAVWLFVGNVLYQVDVDTLKISPLIDLTAQGPVGVCSFDANHRTFWFAGGVTSGINGAALYSMAASSRPVFSPQRLARGRAYAL